MWLGTEAFSLLSQGPSSGLDETLAVWLAGGSPHSFPCSPASQSLDVPREARSLVQIHTASPSLLNTFTWTLGRN